MVATSDAKVEERKLKVYGLIFAKAVSAAEKAFARNNPAATVVHASAKGTEAAATPVDVPQQPPLSKRRKTLTARDLRAQEDAERYNYLVESSDDEDNSEDSKTPQAQVSAEWKEYMAMKKMSLVQV